MSLEQMIKTWGDLDRIPGSWYPGFCATFESKFLELSKKSALVRSTNLKSNGPQYYRKKPTKRDLHLVWCASE